MDWVGGHSNRVQLSRKAQDPSAKQEHGLSTRELPSAHTRYRLRQHFPEKREVLAVNWFKCQRDPKSSGGAADEVWLAPALAGANPPPSPASLLLTLCPR